MTIARAVGRRRARGDRCRTASRLATGSPGSNEAAPAARTRTTPPSDQPSDNSSARPRTVWNDEGLYLLLVLDKGAGRVPDLVP